MAEMSKCHIILTYLFILFSLVCDRDGFAYPLNKIDRHLFLCIEVCEMEQSQQKVCIDDVMNKDTRPITMFYKNINAGKNGTIFGITLAF